MINAKSLLFLCLTISCTVSGQLLLKKGVPTGSTLRFFDLVRDWRVLLGCLFYVASLFFWLGALKRLPLSIAYPMGSASYALVVLASALFLGEPITLNKVIGVLLVIGGVAFVARG